MISRDERRALRETDTSRLIVMLTSRESRTAWLADIHYGKESSTTDTDNDDADADLAAGVAEEIDDRIPRSVRW